MGWTYDPTALDEPLNQVRLKLGDTNATDPQLDDEEIEFLLDTTDSVEGAAWRGARLLAMRYARSVDKWVGDLKILASQRHRAYLDLASSLETSAMLHGVPSAGGIRTSSKEAMQEDDDLVVPSFFRGIHDNTSSN